MTTAYNGGKCCAFSHVFDMDHWYPDDAPHQTDQKARHKLRLKWMKTEMNKAYNNNKRRQYGYFHPSAHSREIKTPSWKTSHTIQVTVNDSQAGWIVVLKGLRFKKAYTVRNANTGNWVHLYVKTMEKPYAI